MASQKGSIFVTGANGGLGSAIVRHIVESPSFAKTYHGLYTVRNTQRADAVQNVLQKAASAGHKYDLLPLDLSSLASTRKAAEDINKRVANGSLPPIRALILNAAWQEWTTHTMTDDGFDMTFQANYLSHFLLTLLLLKSMDKKNGRIVILGSWSHDTSDKRNTVPGLLRAYEDEKYNQIFKEPVDTEPLARGKWSASDEAPGDGTPGYRRYGASKLCEIMFMRELSKRLTADPELSSIATLSVDPGAMVTSLTRRNNGRVMSAVTKVLGPVISLMARFTPTGNWRTPSQSATDVLNAAFDTNTLGERPNGVYMNGAVKGDVGPEAKDAAKCEKLWKDSLGYAQIHEGDTVLATWQ
ncbi:NAD(P)-binding protein [Xylariaceae sp. FL1651]|nr:NAD(P)-binding protein [Xylariaceae sp. FL1651]